MSALPSLRALQVFETVGHSQNIQDAAKRLGISPGAVSQQIQLLEQELNAALFFKEGRRLRLTAVGLDFHLRCSSAFEQLREAQARLHLDQQQHALHISALPSFLNDWILPRITPWQRTQSPLVYMHFHGSHHEPDYANERIDFRFTYAQSVPQSLHALELFTDRVLPVCHPRLLEKHELNKPADLQHWPLLAVDWQPRFSSPPSWIDWFHRYASSSTFEAPPAWQSFSLSHQALQAVRLGLGIMLAQYSYVHEELASGALCAPFENMSLSLDWPYVMTWQPHVLNKKHAREFHHFIMQQRDA